MPLPMRYGRIAVSQLYPDRIRVNYRYRLSGNIGSTRINDALRASGFRRASGRLQFRGSFSSDQANIGISPFVSFSQDRQYINIYIDINPLTSLHDANADYEGERSFDNRRNWLHPDNVSIDNRRIWAEANTQIWRNETAASDLANTIMQRLGVSTISSFQGAAIDRVELTCDFEDTSPVAAISELSDAFRSVFSNTRRNDLPGASQIHERTDGGIPIVHGTWRQGIVFKVYPKTNRRVRIECEVSVQGFRNLGIRRGLDRHDDDFSNLFGSVAPLVIDTFNAILDYSGPPPPQEGSQLDFILGVGEAFRDVDVARALIEQISVSQSISSRSHGARVRRLEHRGFLERVSRGIYRVTAYWRSAVREVAANCRHALAGFLRAAMK